MEQYRSYVERIPKIVHFIKTDGNPNNFKAIHYLAVLSAHYWFAPLISCKARELGSNWFACDVLCSL